MLLLASLSSTELCFFSISQYLSLTSKGNIRLHYFRDYPKTPGELQLLLPCGHLERNSITAEQNKMENCNFQYRQFLNELYWKHNV